MAQTTIPYGSPLAAKVFGAAVFAEVTRAKTFSNKLTGPAPKHGQAVGKLREQTSADFPFVRVMDLSKGQGDSVSVDLFNILTGMPVIGDETIQGKRLALAHSSMDVKVNQTRFGVDPGGRMTQQRTVHDLRTTGKAGIEGIAARLDDQRKMVHLAGARGDQDTVDWSVPLASHDKFADIMINPVKAPSHNRHFYGGDATSIDSIDNTDILTLDTISEFAAVMAEADFPLQPIRFPDDPAAEEEPLYVWYLTKRQWHWLKQHTNATTQVGWRTFLANARERGANNPLFTGTAGMWDGILLKPMGGRAIRFHQGSTVTVAADALAYTESTATVPTWEPGTAAGMHAVDRSIILGAQALACVYAKHGKSGVPMSWFEGEEDDGNRKVASVSMIAGDSKIYFTDAAGRHTDHGVAVCDSYAPNPGGVKTIGG